MLQHCIWCTVHKNNCIRYMWQHRRKCMLSSEGGSLLFTYFIFVLVWIKSVRHKSGSGRPFTYMQLCRESYWYTDCWFFNRTGMFGVEPWNMLTFIYWLWHTKSKVLRIAQCRVWCISFPYISRTNITKQDTHT